MADNGRLATLRALKASQAHVAGVVLGAISARGDAGINFSRPIEGMAGGMDAFRHGASAVSEQVANSLREAVRGKLYVVSVDLVEQWAGGDSEQRHGAMDG